MLLYEITDLGGLARIERDADQLRSLLSEALRQGSVLGDLGDTWATPGRPEVEDDDTASKVRKLHATAVKIAQVERGRRWRGVFSCPW